MKEEDILNLSESQIQKIERVNKSITDRLDAEARLESQKKYRILFERTSREALPFIVYVIYMGTLALVVLFRLLEYTDVRLWIGAFLLFVVMVAPLFVLPSESWKKLLGYLKNKLTKSSIEGERKERK